MNVNQDEFLSKFYNDFLSLKTEVRLLRSLLVTHLGNGNKELTKNIDELLENEKVKLFESVALESDFGEQYLDDKTKKMIDDIKKGLKK